MLLERGCPPSGVFIMKRAFTLIELLVVIAIIAILAAILFPVFAQAKEAAKKTASLSNAKQTGTSTMIYIADSDDVFPKATLRYNNAWYAGTVVPAPINAVATGVYASAALRQSASEVAPGSLQPYTKNNELNKQGDNVITIGTYTYTAGVNVNNGLTMNGFMQHLSSSSVNNASAAVLFWGGGGNSGYKNFASNNPQLVCAAADTSCTWSAGTTTVTGSSFGPDPTWAGAGGYRPYGYTHGVAVIRTDTSAKWRKVGVQENKTDAGPYNEDVWNDPFASVFPDSGSYGYQYFGCNTGEGNGYDPASTAPEWHCFFRPDRAK